MTERSESYGDVFHLPGAAGEPTIRTIRVEGGWADHGERFVGTISDTHHAIADATGYAELERLERAATAPEMRVAVRTHGVALVAKIRRLEADNRALLAERTELLDVLRAVEWRSAHVEGWSGPIRAACPSCRAMQADGHSPACRLAAALRGATARP